MYSNDKANISWSQADYMIHTRKGYYSIYIATASYKNKKTLLNEEYKIVVPISIYSGILNLQKQKKTLILDIVSVLFYLLSFIFYLLSFICTLLIIFWSLDIMNQLEPLTYKRHFNSLFFYGLAGLMICILFGMFLFKDRRSYYNLHSTNNCNTPKLI